MTVAAVPDPKFGLREWLWIVFDNLHALGRVDEHFEFRARKNRLLGTMEEDSQFEVKGSAVQGVSGKGSRGMK